ncbi:MAG: hypothetical protein IJ268_05660 [Proteobacteria bacterium]|nr:hypothetical protein [Pseudomonadota bacterium]MBQ9242045.1 hypothetical protein [Pseudomonadota bacterium]
MNIRANHSHATRRLAMGIGCLIFALAPALAFADRPEINCDQLSDEDSQNFYDLSARCADAAANKNYEEALSLGIQAMSICTTDVYTEYTLARVYQLTNDCPNAYYHYELLSNRPPEVQKDNADIYKGLAKNFKEIKNKCGDVVTLEVVCETPETKISITGINNGQRMSCPFFGKVTPGSFTYTASKEGYTQIRDTFIVSAEGANITIPALQDANATGYVRIRCPKGSSKFILTDDKGKTEEYVCPWEGNLQAGTYKIRLGGSPAEDATTLVIEKKGNIEYSIPNVAKANCSATPLSNSSAPVAGALLALLGALGFGTLRRRRQNNA